ncbi:valine--pyruvate transaminase [Gammaproteobacteria bacterium]|nr:valine--pyruvate transaminase [Gammaproteobacteria bacterium]
MIDFNHHLRAAGGVQQLMDDLSSANATLGPHAARLGGGNPAAIPDVDAVFARRLREIADSPEQLARGFTHYTSPQGDARFREHYAAVLRERYGWPVDADNLVISNGSQQGFFSLFNTLTGGSGGHRPILLPMAPEYIGYRDLGVSGELFDALQPTIELLDGQQFRYHVDHDALSQKQSIAALCLSRPCNPTGGVISDQTLQQLHAHAQSNAVPLIVDNAYGDPFPGLVFRENSHLPWLDGAVYCFSLSKIGLPGVRSGIFVAPRELARDLSTISARLNLAPANVGPVMIEPLITSGELQMLCEQVIQPYYRECQNYALAVFAEHFADLPVRIHATDGGFFFWLWAEGLPGGAQALYETLKKQQVIVVPGEHFFPQALTDWPHSHQCLRINIGRPRAEIDRGLRIIAETLRTLYR